MSPSNVLDISPSVSFLTNVRKGIGTGMGLKESGQGFTSFPEGNGKLWVKQVCGMHVM
jgi:hypothetical protein